MPKTKVEVYDKDQLIYPYIESDHVTFSNGMKVSEMLDQSISMPKVIHEDLSFKVGVGDQDVSSAIVDSSVAEMTIKGKTYQNILPEPSTHVLTNNKEMFKVNEGLDPNVEIVDGVSKSAILSGQTLVNIRGKAVDTQANLIDYEVYGLQNNTTYTIVVESTDTNVISVVGFLKDTGNWNCQAAPRTQNCKVVLTTTSAELMGIVRVRKDNKQDTSQAIQIRVMVLKGDYSNVDIPHFEGMQSVKMPVLTTVGKNLWKRGDLNNFDTMFIDEIIPEGTYYFSGEQTTTYDAPVAIALRDSKNNVLGNTSLGGKITINKKASQIAIYSNGHNYANSAGKFLSVNNFMMEKGSAATLYEPYKSNILSTPEEVVLRSLPNGIKDTLNLNTGEYVQRIKEVVLDGSSDEFIGMVNVNDITLVRFNINNVAGVQTGNTNKVLCSSLPYLYIHGLSGGSATVNQECISNHSQDANTINIVIKRSRLSSVDVAGFKAYLQSNPITIQYSIATPIVKTVDLSSSGNWEKIVYNGTESWNKHDTWSSGELLTMHTSCRGKLVGGLAFSDKFDGMKFSEASSNSVATKECIRYDAGSATIYVFIKKSRLQESSIDGFKQWLKDNGLTVWYQTETHQDSTQVKQPIFFKDGHIQLSSGADNSLIPTLDYQAKTSNSYVMDLLKLNTVYTIKATSASGNLLLTDGRQITLSTNRTFNIGATFPSDKLIINKGSATDFMIIEGDVTSKTIPYFKGIKSAFEGEDKIEVLSTGKNLFDGSFEKGVIDVSGNLGYSTSAIRTVNYISVKPNTSYHINLLNLEPFESLRVVYVHEYDENFKVLGEKQVDNRNIYTSKSATKFIKINTHTAHDLPVDSKMIVCENSTLDKQYEPYKSNSTKIPLLSPLRSLPNGVCDEIILDREKNKATLIQRVGHVVFSSNLGHNTEQDSLKTSLFTSPTIYSQASGVRICDRFLNDENSNLMLDSMQAKTESEGLGSWSAKENFNIRILVSRLGGVPSTHAMTNWLKENPVTILYHLKTPIITEVDLEGFPYIYKDGHIFLNSEIAPTTEIIYSINQCQQISASNEDIIRHEKELTYLQKLIAQYVQVDYESALLSLKV